MSLGSRTQPQRATSDGSVRAQNCRRLSEQPRSLNEKAVYLWIGRSRCIAGWTGQDASKRTEAERRASLTAHLALGPIFSLRSSVRRPR